MALNFKQVVYERSFGTASQLEPSTLPEISFAGRSNVGKSSLINKLFNRKRLAKVSQTPGKTATINFFKAGDVRFVDLPGYGYARVSKSEQARWSELIEGYFNQDRNFALVCSLLDVRHLPTDLDEHMIWFLRESGLPFATVFTKGDKLSRQRCLAQVKAIRTHLELEDDVPWVLTSALKGSGLADLRELIAQTLE